MLKIIRHQHTAQLRSIQNTVNKAKFPRATRARLSLITLLLVGLLQQAALAQTLSDLLIVMESDGRTHTVQHTLATSQSRLGMKLPGSVIPQQIRFMGDNAALNATNYQLSPDTIWIDSGSVFARYRHQYGEQISHQSGRYTLSTPSIPASVIAENNVLEESSMTWVFPSELDIISYTAIDDETGKWVLENNTLSYFQHTLKPVTLRIEFRKNEIKESIAQDRCSTDSNNDACSPDDDKDGIPNYRDICDTEQMPAVNALGCHPEENIILRDISFPSGHNYLDAQARRKLDTVAYALRHSSKLYFEIGAHTDNVGSASNNKKLSQKRADAVRHYLLLRGVEPNVIRAKGYGENYPIKDNAQASGQRANRRVELSIIK